MRMADLPPGPADYDPGPYGTVAERKPAWGFGKATRRFGSGSSSLRVPGPGSYEVEKSTIGGPQFSITPRRPVKMHPSQRMTFGSATTPRTPRANNSMKSHTIF